MMLSVQAQSDFPRPLNAEDFFVDEMPDVRRWTGLARESVPASNGGHVFAVPDMFARQTVTTGKQMCREKVMFLASVVALEEETFREAAKPLREHIRRWGENLRVIHIPALEDEAADLSLPLWVKNLSSGSQVSDVATTIESLFTHMDMEGGLAAVDNELARIDIDKANHVHLVALLRALFFSRSKLKNWILLRDQTYELLGERGKNAEKVMAGLNAD